MPNGAKSTAMKTWFGFICLLLAALTAQAASTRITRIDAGNPNTLLQTTNRAPYGLGEFQPNLPILFLESKVNIETETKVPCTVRLVCPSGAACGTTNVLAARIKLHGASSTQLPKKSYALSLDDSAQLLDLSKRDDWVLQAAYIDRSLMRHKLSYDLFLSLSAPHHKRYASASRFVEVYRNKQYAGVYLLMERLDRKLFELRKFDSNDVSHACIYKAVSHGASFDSLSHGSYEQREPDPVTLSYWGPLNEFNQFANVPTRAAFFDSSTGIVSRLDIDCTIDFHLLVLITSNQDGIDKNFLFGRDAVLPGKPSPKFFFSPWDYDATFGRNWDASRYPVTVWLSNFLFERLLRDKDYRDRFVARWNYLKEHEFSVKTIQGMIDANARALGEAVRRNVTRWPLTSGHYPDLLTFEEDLAEMKAWVVERTKFLDTQINTNLANGKFNVPTR
jgi:hypothetical protein